jgi:hypothetical protein
MARRRTRRRTRRRSSYTSNVNSMMKPMMGMVALGGTAIIGAAALRGVGGILNN